MLEQRFTGQNPYPKYRQFAHRPLFYILPTIKGVIIFTHKSDKIPLLPHDFGNVLIEKQKVRTFKIGE